MAIKSVSVIYFSPTGTSFKIAESFALGLACDSVQWIDITDPNLREKSQDIKSDLVVIGFPVYEEHIPPFVLDSLKKMQFNVKAAAGFSLYGNIGYGRSLQEIHSFCSERKIPVLGLGAFIGEHSFATSEAPLAVGRPNLDDLAEARMFGKLVSERFDSSFFLEKKDIPGKIPFVARFMPKNSAKIFTSEPVINSNCIKCGLCISKCPMGAINSDYSIDNDKCIRCFACVKSCKFKGREIKYKKRFLIKPMFNLSNLKKKKNFII
ncbi:MAG: 4Fe-4S binding protein [Spirochaetales bacterium]|nr:4Fe-4S binding protein [Spirochaetales bacterium]